MKVKIGDRIYNSEYEAIMIIFDKDEKEYIRNMSDDATKYCSYPSTMEEKEAKEFMSMDIEV